MVMDVDQSRRENMARAVQDIRVVSGELTPAVAGSYGKNATVFKGDEGVGAVQT